MSGIKPAPVNTINWRSSGFTLIELLVVIVIISIILSMATLAINTGSAKDRLKTEAQRFTALVKLAQDDSLLNASEFGVALSTHSYQFVVMTETGWQPVGNNASLRERQLPADMQLDLELDFEAVDLQSSVTKIGEVSKVDDVEKFEDSEKKKYKPQIYLLSSGEIMPSFMLIFSLADEDIRFSVQGAEDGSLQIKYHAS